MPQVSEAQRRLMYAASAKPGGAGGVSQSVGEDFTSADKPGKLPEKKKTRSSKMYGKKDVGHG